MVFGMIITNKMARVWPGGPTAFDLHEYTSLLGMAFALFHAMILMGDHYINYNLAQIFTPFASLNYRPVWVGLGQIGFYVWVLVTASFYVRKRIGARTWRLIHYASFIAFIMALLHGITSGTDTGFLWTSFIYWLAGGSLLFLLIYRILTNRSKSIIPRNMS
jgi:predicted ferric reductase